MGKILRTPLVLTLLALTLLANDASVQAEVDLNALINANGVLAVHEVYPCTAQHIVYYDAETGNVSNSISAYTMNDLERGMIYTQVHRDGTVVSWGGGGYGRYGGSGKLYVSGCVADYYEKKMLLLGAQNLGEFDDGQTITAEGIAEDGKLRVTIEGPIKSGNPNYGEEYIGSTLVVRYVLNPENLIIESSEAYIRGEDGVEKLYLATSVEIDPSFELPFDASAIETPEALREVHVIMNPGTDAETDYILTAPANVFMGIYTPDGYALYDDAACTASARGLSMDEHDAYPESMTVYCAPAAD